MKTKLTGATGEDLARATRLRKALRWWVASGIVVVGILIYFAYKPWRLESLRRTAREALQRGDYSGASLAARRALQVDPGYVPACLAMAEIGDHDRVSDAIVWRERVLRLAGETPDNLIALASTSLNLGKISTANSALARVPGKDREREDFLVLGGTVALEARRPEDAISFYEEAARLNPEKAAYRLALGRAQCASEDFLVREQGRQLLKALSADETLGVAALRALVTSCEARQEIQAALRYSQQLVALRGHDFSDEILQLRLLHATGDDKFDAILGATKKKAEQNSSFVGALLVWMSHAGLAADALDWVTQRIPELGKSPDVFPALAGCQLSLGNWDTLLEITQAGAWKRVEYVRHAYRARAFRERSEISFARNEWNLANGAAARQVEALAWLARMATEWGWSEESEESLWTLLEFAPSTQWAIESLQSIYLCENDTPGLKRIAVHLVKNDPADDNARNDLALVSLLLNTEADRGMTLAQELHARHPENAAYTSTYAFALHCAGRTAEGLKIMETLPPQRLEDPAIAAYYGILLASSDSRDKAQHFLEIGREGRLLPEEEDLVAKAERLIDSAADVSKRDL